MYGKEPKWQLTCVSYGDLLWTVNYGVVMRRREQAMSATSASHGKPTKSDVSRVDL